MNKYCHDHNHSHDRTRREFFSRAGVGALLLTPLAGLLAACGKNGDWPDGMAAIHWDRDTCTGCGMVISDRRFAMEVRGGPNDAAFKFDDIGCFFVWRKQAVIENPWLATAAARLWVADASAASTAAPTARWLDPRAARYAEQSSPMGYNLAALPADQAGAAGIDFEEAARRVLARGMSGAHEMPAAHGMKEMQ
ncbi:MAG: hypothetical protein LBI92_10135 [Azoarcus sp.]|jgi:nitrous oxide reductase accessory protein NosL|nr:hypothetical protein [Azoarcus sp.]